MDRERRYGVAELAELLRESYYARGGSLGEVEAQLGTIPPTTPEAPAAREVTELARRLARRIVWIQTRREQFTTGTHGRAQRHRVTLEGSSDGRISRAKIDLLAETGAYPHNGSAIPMFSRLVATGMYDIPRLEFDTTIVVTNRAPTGSYRGAGRPEAALGRGQETSLYR